jgi:hypothetical protein
MSTQSETLKCSYGNEIYDRSCARFHRGAFVGHAVLRHVGRSVGYYGNAVSPIVPNRALHPKSHATQGSTAVTR